MKLLLDGVSMTSQHPPPFSHTLNTAVWNMCLLSCVAAGVGSTLYFSWAQDRASARAMVHDEFWPRSNPYPDVWIVALNDWFDKRYPVRPGLFKIHGELDRVRWAITGLLSWSLLLVFIGAAPLIYRNRNVIKSTLWSFYASAARLRRTRST